MRIIIESIGVRYVDGTVDDIPVSLSITPDRTFGELREWMDKENRKAGLPVPIFAIECFKAVAVIRSDGVAVSVDESEGRERIDRQKREVKDIFAAMGQD